MARARLAATLLAGLLWLAGAAGAEASAGLAAERAEPAVARAPRFDVADGCPPGPRPLPITVE